MFTNIDDCNDDVCDANANCTNTNGSHNCICKEGYIEDGQSCQYRLEQRYFMLSKAAFLISIFFVTEVIITSRKRNDFQAPTTYFYKVTGFIISIHTHFSTIRVDILRVAKYFFESGRNDDK